MNDMISTLAGQLGLSPEMIQKGVGALLAGLKGLLPPDLFAKLQGAVPDSQAAMSAAETEAAGSSGGVLGSLAGLAGKLFGGKSTEALAMLAKVGFTPEQIQEFIPRVFEYLKGVLPPQVLDQIKGHIPGLNAE